ncbi:MAG: hypothetical protein ACI9GW_002936 [Halieaceae bacterium]|jgi:hypothetical protein
MAQTQHPQLPMRPSDLVMDLKRLGSFYPTRLSFMRSLLRRVFRENWKIETTVFDLDDQAYGTAIYEVSTTHGEFSFVIFSDYLPDEKRNDRVIATQWDLTMALCEGRVDPEFRAMLRNNVPLQEGGRLDARVLVMSRANRSVRNFDYVVDELAAGRQPAAEQLTRVGYLFRTTAVYGSGKFGMADWEKVSSRFPDFNRPFAAEMFTCFLLRQFSLDLVDHLARQRGPKTAVGMHPKLQRYIGIGNATGLGMAPFLIYHPQLTNRWVTTRESALATVMVDGQCDDATVGQLRCLAAKAYQHLFETFIEDERQGLKNRTAQTELEQLDRWLVEDFDVAKGWHELISYSETNFSVETQEILISILLELFPELVDIFDEFMCNSDSYLLNPEMPIAELRGLICSHYQWALDIDFTKASSQHTFWYRSQEKMEPRLGELGVDPGEDLQMPVDVARSVVRCYASIEEHLASGEGDVVAHFVCKHPEHREIVRRIQTMSSTTYGDIRANLVDADCLPLDLLRCKLSFFGVSKFDPKSRLWVRNTMYQGAPLVADIGTTVSDDWCFPLMPTTLEPIH